MSRKLHLCVAITYLVLSTNSVLFSQDNFLPGYLVNNEGDTISGFIDYGNPKSNAAYCLFKRTRNDEKAERYNPEDLQFFRFRNSKLYISKTINLKNISGRYFLEYLLDGIVEIYFLAHPFKDYFLIEKDGKLYELSNEEKILLGSNGRFVKHYATPYSGVIHYVMQDAPTLSDEINELNFDHNSFIRIGKKYHNLLCEPGNPCIIYSRRKKKLYDIPMQVRFGAYMGIAKSTDDNFTQDSKLYPSLALNLSSNWRTSGQLDFQYHANKILIHQNQTTNSDLVKVALTLNYEFLDLTKTTPFVRGGISLNKYYYRRGQYTTGPSFHHTYLGALGVLYRIGKSYQLKTELIYDSTNLKLVKYSAGKNDRKDRISNTFFQFGCFYLL